MDGRAMPSEGNDLSSVVKDTAKAANLIESLLYHSRVVPL